MISGLGCCVGFPKTRGVFCGAPIRIVVFGGLCCGFLHFWETSKAYFCLGWGTGCGVYDQLTWWGSAVAWFGVVSGQGKFQVGSYQENTPVGRPL